MKTKNIIAIIALLLGSGLCHAQVKDFRSFLNKFQTVTLPFHHKKMEHKWEDLTKEDALKFLQKKEDDLYYMEMSFGYDTEEISYTKRTNLPGFDFKFPVNDSVYIVCVKEAFLGGAIDTIMSRLYSFTPDGKIIDQGVVVAGSFVEGGAITTALFSCVFLNKNQFRVYFYEMIDEERSDGFLSSVHYVEYLITDCGRFIEKYKSEVAYLNKFPAFYREYDPNSDDPMNKYEF